MICPLCWDAKGLTDRDRITSTELGGTIPMWEWIGDDGATTFSFRGSVAMATSLTRRGTIGVRS